VEFDIFGTYVEPHPRETAEALRVGLVARPDQDEVEMADSDMVGVDVNLFHDAKSAFGAFESNLWSGRKTPFFRVPLDLPSVMA
jgi:hypothetical protein